MTYHGHIENGSVVLDDAVVLPEGAKLRVELLSESGKTLAERFDGLIGCVSDLPADMAENHDYEDSSDAKWRDRISIKPEVCHGKPCIKGTRIWVSLILDFLATGSSEEEILREYPHLTSDDIRACIAYGAEAARERYILVPTAEQSR
jgi:uncharacterized protein (DUF433 family)